MIMKGKFDAYYVTVTFDQKVPKLNSRLVYCSQLYGMWVISELKVKVVSLGLIQMIISDAGTGGARGATGPPNIWQIS